MNQNSNLQSELESIIIRYKIRENEEKIKIFGDTFIENNTTKFLFFISSKFKLFCEDKEYDLEAEFEVKNCKKIKIYIRT